MNIWDEFRARESLRLLNAIRLADPELWQKILEFQKREQHDRST